MRSSKTVLTTGEVAKLCNVAPRTVSKWFDAGHLRGYRIPGSKDRRIPLEQLVRFMRAHGIPLNGLDSGQIRVLLVESSRELSEAIRARLDATGDYEVQIASSALEAGAAAQLFRPHLLVVDVDLADVDPAAFVRFMQSSPDLHGTALVATGNGLSEPQGRTLLQQGFAAFLAKPFELAELIEVMSRASGRLTSESAAAGSP